MGRNCVVGDSGLLGQALVQELATGESDEVLGISTSPFTPSSFWRPLRGRYIHHSCDVLQENTKFFSLLDKFRPEILINCIALTNLSECEKHPEFAETLNAEWPGRLSEWARRTKTAFVHVSTDQVFDGQKKAPYTEDDLPNPRNVYGKTKLLGERKVLDQYSDALILRTNIVGFKDRRDQPTFAEWLNKAFLKSEAITLFEDYVTSSIHVADFSDLLLDASKKKLKGVWHVATQDSASKYDFGKMLAEKAGLDFSQVKKGRLVDAHLDPSRPPYLALDVRRAEKKLDRKFPSIINTISQLAEDIQARSGSDK